MFLAARLCLWTMGAKITSKIGLYMNEAPVHYHHNPIKTVKTSFLTTYNMLGLARRMGARLLMASTSAVYSDPEVHPLPESFRSCVNTWHRKAKAPGRVGYVNMRSAHRKWHLPEMQTEFKPPARVQHGRYSL